MALIGVRRTLLRPRAIVIPTTPPVLTFGSANSTSTSTATQGVTGLSVGTAAPRRMVIATLTGDASIAGVLSSATITPNVGTAKSAIIAVQTASSTIPICAIIYAVLDADADTATTVDISLTFSANPSRSFVVNTWTTPSAGLLSSTPVDAQQARASAATTVSISNLTTSAGGFIIAGGVNGTLTSTSSAYSGSETMTLRTNSGVNSGCNTSADASNVSAHAANCTVTATFSASDNTGLVAASWR